MFDRIFKGLGTLNTNLGRKFFVTVITLFISSVLIWHSKIDAIVYRDIIIATVGIYISGNVIQRNTEVKNGVAPTDG